jgi:glycosyltransferase involved in cell wall biosynthesis
MKRKVPSDCSPSLRQMRVVVCATEELPFVRDDIVLLRKSFFVDEVIGSGVKQLLRIVKAAANADIVFCWFASVYAFWAVLFGRLLHKRSIVVVGGVDVAYEPEIGYGIWLSPWKRRLVKYALRKADAVLAVDQTLADEVKMRAHYNGDNVRVVPTGYRSDEWIPGVNRERKVLTVAKVTSMSRARIKGIDILFETARRLPAVRFVVVGVNGKIAKELQKPANVEIVDAVDRAQLLPYYQSAKVYCQPSLREGLPNTLCEAMLCECIPVATNVGGNSTAVGPAGILVPMKNPDALATAIENALNMNNGPGKEARKRIQELFPQERREIELKTLIQQLSM